jgi:hypothetical protein
MVKKLPLTFRPVPGFIPGQHCTQVEHHVKGELALLPPPHERHPDARYVCAACLPRVLKWKARSDAAKRGTRLQR